MQTRTNNAIPGADDIVRETLPNGITVLVRENFTTAAAVIGGSVRVGGIFETADKAGMATFTAGSLMRGTLNRDFDALHETLESIGASLGIGGGVHSTGFNGKSLAEDLRVLLTLLSDALRNPAFPVSQTERLRGEIITGLKIRAQDTRSVASEAWRKMAYPEGHPYSRSSSGDIATISGITLDEMAEFHHKHYGPRGMLLVIVGAVKAADAIQLAKDILGDWRNPLQPTVPLLTALPPLPEARRQFAFVPGKTQSDIVLGWPGPLRLAPDFQAANLANSILGVFGMMGRLGKSVREEQGLAYHSSSRLAGGLGPGPWQISAGVSPANVYKAIDSILVEIARMTDELVSEDDLADNKANFTGRLPLNLESNEGVASSILNMEIYGLGLDYLRHYAEMINAITREDLQAAVQKYLSPKAYALAVAGPELAPAGPDSADVSAAVAQ